MPGKHSTAIRKRSVSIAGHRTSVSLEQAFWQVLKEIAAAEGRSVAAIIAGVDAGGIQPGVKKANLSSALRVYVLEKIQERGNSC
ncbi:MAG: ribbon-helix-helix domain-containing protein [Proteobacteria bacterium]|nr:ribbon-helix-helix domain-containing protein [Pseudomonadota bacterium]